MRVYFTDFWVGLNQTDNFIYNALSKHYALEIDAEHPEVLFFSCYGNHYLSYENCIKVFYTGENVAPNFAWCDYAIGFDYIDFGDRYIRIPQYAIQPNFGKLYQELDYSEELCNRKFCNFVYSNNAADPIRNKFFEELSRIKHVDSGGGVMNNIGGPVDNKLEFISNYKFTIAFENSVYPGYTTEKLVEPMICKSLPIYFGNPMVDRDFNPEAFVWVKNESDIKRAIEETMYLDGDNKAYMKKLSAPKLRTTTYEHLDNLIVSFIGHIFEQPIGLSYRLPTYGFIKLNNKFIFGEINWDDLRNPKVEKKKRLRKILKNLIRKIK